LNMEKHVQKLILACAETLFQTQGPEASIDMIFDILDYSKAKYAEDEVYELIESKYPLMIDSRGLPGEGIPHGIYDRS
jgi:hypothetical protein